MWCETLGRLEPDVPPPHLPPSKFLFVRPFYGVRIFSFVFLTNEQPHPNSPAFDPYKYIK